jgi:hypothetical protein
MNRRQRRAKKLSRLLGRSAEPIVFLQDWDIRDQRRLGRFIANWRKWKSIIGRKSW